ncbi:Rz1-like phage lysis lipoprotein [Burkholderia phage Bcep22]|uniref:Rz1-like phage lysis lipoprotein n=1 Tax=Burkholderia phage Bcep22 TaxID=2883944 RepID=A8YQQ8_9CAUD|nr:Rz-like spanin [Burkholderia phage Bcep22]ABW74911.1 Rz1-like phage lysis lipoprotein [Burkholderia phage Bcep22]
MRTLKTLIFVAVSAAALSACTSARNVPPPPAVACLAPPPPPAWTMKPSEPNLTQRLRANWLELPATATTQSVD